MHDIAPLRIPAQYIRDDLAESFWKKTFVEVLYS
jgi:hypothetical protein